MSLFDKLLAGIKQAPRKGNKKIVVNKYKDNLYLEQYEIKGVDYDYRDRPLDARLHTEHEPQRYERKGDAWVAKKSNDGKARILFAGDITCFEKQIEEAKTGKDEYDFDYIFEKVKGIFAQSDLAIGNLETMIVPEAPYRTEQIVSEQAFMCNAPLQFLDAVRKTGFDCLVNANNHDYDTGAVGIGVTIDYINQMGMFQTGTFKTDRKRYEIIEVGGMRIGLVNMTHYHNYKEDNLTDEGLDFLFNTYTKERAQDLYEQAKADGAEIVIMFAHWGHEYQEASNALQHKMRDEMIDIGYDAIVGLHPHVLQPFEIVDTGSKKVPVFYSIGNFVTNHVGNDRGRAVIACLDLKRTDKGIQIDCSYVPIVVSNIYSKKSYAIVPLKEVSAVQENRGDLQLIRERMGDQIDVTKGIEYADYKPVVRETSEKEKPKKARKKRRKAEPKEGENWPVRYDAGKFIYDIYEDHVAVAGINPENKGQALTITKVMKGKLVTDINPGAFSGRGIVRKFNISSGITVISERAFKGCPDLEGFFDDSQHVEVIDKEAFADCPKFNCLVARKGLKEIREKAFSNCRALKSVKLYDGVEYIADDAFEGCDKLTFYCAEGSYPYNWAREHNIPVKHLVVNRNVNRPLATLK